MRLLMVCVQATASMRKMCLAVNCTLLPCPLSEHPGPVVKILKDTALEGMRALD